MKERIPGVLKALLVIVLLAGIGWMFYMSLMADVNNRYEATNEEYEALKVPYIEVEEIVNEVPLVSDAVLSFLKEDQSAVDIYQTYSGDGDIYGVSAPVLRVVYYNMPHDVTVVKQTVELAMVSDKDKVENHVFAGDARELMLEDLYADSIYSFRIVSELSNGMHVKKAGKFTTMDTPRLISEEGVWNVRDFGGVKTEDGRTVRQGRLYRGSQLDGQLDETYTAESVDTEGLMERFGLRTEFDLMLNQQGIQPSVLGDTVERYCYKVAAYELVPPGYSAQMMKKLVGKLMESRTYPAYIHCDYGTDATGTLCYLLDMMLGVSEEDAYRRWELSGLQYGELDYDAMDAFVKQFNNLSGDTGKEKAEGYLLSIGVTMEEIDSVREELLD